MADASSSSTNSPLTRIVKDESGNRRVEMKCPKCETWQDVLAYKNPDMVNKYAHALNAIVKCVRCRHLFSPRWLNDEGSR